MVTHCFDEINFPWHNTFGLEVIKSYYLQAQADS